MVRFLAASHRDRLSNMIEFGNQAKPSGVLVVSSSYSHEMLSDAVMIIVGRHVCTLYSLATHYANGSITSIPDGTHRYPFDGQWYKGHRKEKKWNCRT
jgi:hypothetical protein